MHSRFAEVVAETASAGLRFSMVSNGWSFPKHLAALPAHRQRLATITFSLDGARQATHDALRGRGSFRRILQAASVLPVSFAPGGWSEELFPCEPLREGSTTWTGVAGWDSAATLPASPARKGPSRRT